MHKAPQSRRALLHQASYDLEQFDTQQGIDDITEYDLSDIVPSNDVAGIARQHLRKELTAVQNNLKHKEIQISHQLVLGNQTMTEIASRVNLHPTTIANTVKRPKVKRYINLLLRLKSLDDGSNYRQRELLLWRIAQQNEISDPRTAISAVAEINRTKADTPEAELRQKENENVSGATQVIIQLADARLIASPLDELPNHMRDIN